MGEYGREQRNQLSRGIADSKPGSGQLKEFVDNRTKYTTNSAMPNSTQYKHSNSTSLFPVQLSRIWSSKGNIIRSVELPVEKKKPGTFNRGQIVGGIEHKEGTPGTSFANDIVNMLDKGSPLRSLGWKGGHLLKHQWGGGKTTGNVVAWPSVAENSWGLNFENRIESIIQKLKVLILQ